MKPDLECYIDRKRYLIDVSFVNNMSKTEQRFKEKIDKYIKT